MTCQNGLSKISNELLGRKPVVDNDAKLRPLYLLKTLKEQTDEDHALSMAQLCKKLKWSLKVLHMNRLYMELNKTVFNITLYTIS